MGFWQFATGGGSGGGTGDVVGPASSVDDQIAVFDGVTGKLLSASAATLTAAGSLTIPAGQTVAISSSSVNSASLFQATTANPAFSGQILFDDSAGWLFRNKGLAAAAPIAIGTAGATLAPASQLYWSSSAAEGNLRPAFADTSLGRIAAGQLAVKNVTNGMANNIKIATTTVNAAGATSTASNLVPAGCILLGVTTRVTTAITSGDGGTSVNIGNGTDADMYGATIAFALGTTTTLASHTASALAFVSAAQNVVFTCVGGTFSGGVWRVCAHFLDLSAPTS